MKNQLSHITKFLSILSMCIMPNVMYIIFNRWAVIWSLFFTAANHKHAYTTCVYAIVQGTHSYIHLWLQHNVRGTLNHLILQVVFCVCTTLCNYSKSINKVIDVIKFKNVRILWTIDVKCINGSHYVNIDWNSRWHRISIIEIRWNLSFCCMLSIQ